MQALDLDDVSVVVLAGGRGTRISALYPDIPKPLILVEGKPFLHWQTAYFAKFGLNKFIYSTGHMGGQIDSWCQDQSFPSLKRTAVHESQPLGTGGGLLNCLDLCREWVVVTNGDSLCIGGLADLLAVRHDPEATGGIIGVHRADTARYGSLEVEDTGWLKSFREKVKGAGYINGGTYMFNTDALRSFARGGASSLEQDLLPRLLAQGLRLRAILLPDAPFIDIGTPESVVEADAFVRAHLHHFDALA